MNAIDGLEKDDWEILLVNNPLVIKYERRLIHFWQHLIGPSKQFLSKQESNPIHFNDS
jgi:hypothetical protein